MNNLPTENAAIASEVTPANNPTSNPVDNAIPSAPSQNPSNPRALIKSLLVNKKRFIIIILIVFLGLFVFTTGVFAMVAYGKLPIGSPKFRVAVADTFMSLPFMPKTPEYVIRRSMKKSVGIKKFGFDASLAVDGAGDILGLSTASFDLNAKGALDLSDSKNPSGHVKLLLAKDFDLDLRAKNKIVYVKLNKFPQTILTMLSAFGFPQSIMNDIINQWFYFDTTPLETEARKIQESKEDNTDKKARQVNEALFDALANGTIKLKNSMVSEKLDKLTVYKITTIVDAKAISSTQRVISKALDEEKKPIDKKREEKIEKSVAETLSDIEVISYIDKSGYNLRKIAIFFKVREPRRDSALGSNIEVFSGPLSLGSMDKEIPVSMVFSYNSIGEPVNVDIPKDSLSINELQKRIMEKLESATPSGLIGGSHQRASNSKRRADVNMILIAITQFSLENKGLLPAGIDTQPKMIAKTSLDLCSLLSPRYIAEIPADPNINMGRGIADCKSNYMTGYMVSKSLDGKVTVSSLYAENGIVISETR